MKFSLLFAAFFVCSVFAQLPDLGATLRDFLEKTRNRFQCGFKQLNIPTLDPFSLTEYSASLGTIADVTNVQVTATNTIVRGLKTFQVTKFEAAIFESRLSFGLTYPALQFDGVHKTTAGLNGEALSGKGDLSVTAKNVHVDVTIIFSFFPSFQIVSHKLTGASVGETTIAFKGFADKTLDASVSASLSKGASAWVANNLDLLNNELAKAFVPFSNVRLSNFLNLATIIDIVTSYDPASRC